MHQLYDYRVEFKYKDFGVKTRVHSALPRLNSLHTTCMKLKIPLIVFSTSRLYAYIPFRTVQL
jgi:hypothetical protein